MLSIVRIGWAKSDGGLSSGSYRKNDNASLASFCRGWYDHCESLNFHVRRLKGESTGKEQE